MMEKKPLRGLPFDMVKAKAGKKLHVDELTSEYSFIGITSRGSAVVESEFGHIHEVDVDRLSMVREMKEGFVALVKYPNGIQTAGPFDTEDALNRSKVSYSWNVIAVVPVSYPTD